MSEREMDVAIGFGNPEAPLDVSVVLPAYNEADNIDGVYHQVVRVLDPEDLSYEIIFVDDGSTDDTWKRITAIVQRDPRVRALRHRRNFGKASALANGFSYSRGAIIVTSDADMQYDPHDVIRVIEKIDDGFDVVSAYKVVRRDPLSKRLPSRFFNWFVRSTTGVQLHDMNAGLKAFRHEAAEDLVKFGYGELHRFFIVIAAQRGYRVGEVPVESCPRPSGKSKYGFERYMRGALDYVTVLFLSGFTERPLHLLGAIGIAMFFAGGLVAFGILVLEEVQRSIAVWPLVSIAVLLLIGGFQLITSGLLAEMVNNLERGSANRAKISEVMRIDRRTATLIAPGVHVERRRENLEPEVERPVIDPAFELEVRLDPPGDDGAPSAPSGTRRARARRADDHPMVRARSNGPKPREDAHGSDEG